MKWSLLMHTCLWYLAHYHVFKFRLYVVNLCILVCDNTAPSCFYSLRKFLAHRFYWVRYLFKLFIINVNFVSAAVCRTKCMYCWCSLNLPKFTAKRELCFFRITYACFTICSRSPRSRRLSEPYWNLQLLFAAWLCNILKLYTPIY